MERRIVIMAGGTGGHVFPALAVALLLRERGWQVSWLGTRQGLESRVVPQHALPLDAIDVVGWRGKSRAEQGVAVWRLVKALWQAVRCLRQRRPHVVLGMGGFVAAPGGVIARLLGVPLVIHEQNRIPGTTNRWLAHIATRVLEAFPESFAPTVAAVCTGNPLRPGIVTRAAMPRAAYDATRPLRVLVVGGSLGAKVLNETVPEALRYLPQPLEILHQTGGAALRDEVAAAYARLGLTAEVKAFIDDMAESYQWADVAVCRAGAMTIAELAAMALPAVLIPFPYAIDDHQTANARYLAERSAAVLLPQTDLTAKTLAEALQRVIDERFNMVDPLRALAVLDATERVVAWCEQEAQS